MKLSKRTYYALLALIELAVYAKPNQPLQIQYIANKQKIPVRYLEQILFQLKNHGIVRSKNGFYGGFTLRKAPQALTLADIIKSVEVAEPTHVTSHIKFPTSESLTVEHFWKDLSQEVQEILQKYTLQDFCDRVKQQLPSAYMYYI